MAFTENEQRSALSFGGFNRILPVGNGTDSVEQADQQHALWQWRGTLAVAPFIPGEVNYVAAYIRVARTVARRI